MFTTLSSLQTHKRRAHTGEKPFPCDFKGCGSVFVTSVELKTHKRTHTGEKPFRCDFEGCDYAGTTSSHLKTHMRTHTGEKPFPCDFEGCDYAGTTSGVLKVHMRIHTGEKPYPCHIPGCPRRFTRSGSRDLHEKYFHDKNRGELYIKKKEEWVVSLLKREGFGFDREVFISHKACGESDTWARLDFVVHSPDITIILSVDEFQHAYCNYTVGCDVSRMTKTLSSLWAGGLQSRLLWIRFNPDYFEVDGDVNRMTKAQKETLLVHILRNPVEYMDCDDRLFGVLYVCYDSFSEKERYRPCITINPDFPTSFLDSVLPAVF